MRQPHIRKLANNALAMFFTPNFENSLFLHAFIVADSLNGTPFTPVDEEKKEILGFECLKAVSSDGKTTAWHTPHIPVKDEPTGTGLSGLVLEFDNGQQVFTTVQVADSASLPVARPTGEKTVTRSEFTEHAKKRVEMMKRN